MDFSAVGLDLAVTLLLLLLIGLGPKIALVPFLDRTKNLDAEKQREVGRVMVKTAVVAALVVFATGALLLRLLHITTGAVAVAGGIILILLAVKMALGPGEEVVEVHQTPIDHGRLAVYPLAVPFLFNPVGVTVLIIASNEAGSIGVHILVLAIVLLVGAFDYLVFSNIDKLAKRLSPTGLVISEVVFGILLTAVGVQLIVSGLATLGIVETVTAAQH